MKKILILLFICLFLTGRAQTYDNQFIYGNIGFSLGNFRGGNAGLNFAENGNYSLQIEYAGTMRSAESTSTDYGSEMLDLLSLGTITPTDKKKSFRFVAGTIKNFGQSGKTRINLKAGFSFLIITIPTHWVKREGFLITSNYTWDYENTSQLGFVIKPVLEILFTNFIGIDVSPYLELTSEYNSGGIGIELLLGKVKQYG